jgi:hypothetical protein
MWFLSIPTLEATAGRMNTDIPQKLPYGITVRLEQNALRITQNNVDVFHMKVRVIGNVLDVDYPRTTEAKAGPAGPISAWCWPCSSGRPGAAPW